MRRPGQAVAAVAAMLAVVTPTFSEQASARSGPSLPLLERGDSGESDLVGTADPATIPKGRNRKLVVVANGPPDEDSGSVPVIVRNKTKKAATSIEVQGIARDAAGSVVGSGESQGLEPAAVQPGGIALGYVYFGLDSADVLSGATFKFTVSAKRSRGAGKDYFATVDVVEHNKVEGVEFDLLQGQILGLVRNPLKVKVTGPISVLAMCFDEAGAIVQTVSDYTELDDLEPGGESSFSIDYFETPCPTYLIGASGFNERAL